MWGKIEFYYHRGDKAPRRGRLLRRLGFMSDANIQAE
jgi:hypothetical protein